MTYLDGGGTPTHIQYICRRMS